MSLHESDGFKALCEMSFSFYCRQYLKVVEPETEFIWSWYLEDLCKACEDLYYGDYRNIDINIPPRMLKSLIFSVLFPTWVWIKKPSTKIIAASSSFDLANRFNIKRRELVESNEYRMYWNIRMKDYANTITYFENTHNGFMKSVSAEGKVTGSGGDILISDDLIDVKDAFSKVKRDSVREWYSNAFYGRAQNKKTVRRLNINQRTHAEDISGLISEKYDFKKLIIEMVKTDANLSTIPLSDPRKVGELLMPERYGIEEMLEDKKSLGTYGWSSQMQQCPVPIGGGIIKEEWIKYYDPNTIGMFDRMIITGDLNFKKGENTDFAAFSCWGTIGVNKYLVDIIRGKWTYKETKTKFENFCNKYSQAYYKYIENKANGPALISDFSDKIHGMREWPTDDPALSKADKVQRLHMVSAEYEDGNVYLPLGNELVDKFKEELLSFTEKGSATGNDDMVDTSTTALIELRRKETFIG